MKHLVLILGESYTSIIIDNQFDYEKLTYFLFPLIEKWKGNNNLYFPDVRFYAYLKKLHGESDSENIVYLDLSEKIISKTVQHIIVSMLHHVIKYKKLKFSNCLPHHANNTILITCYGKLLLYDLDESVNQSSIVIEENTDSDENNIDWTNITVNI